MGREVVAVLLLGVLSLALASVLIVDALHGRSDRSGWTVAAIVGAVAVMVAASAVLAQP